MTVRLPAAHAHGTISIKAESGDPGIKFAVDEANNAVTVKGTTKGPLVKYDSNREVDDEVSRGVSLSFDHDKMPNFETDPDSSRKNAWYFSHMVSMGKGLGIAAATLAKELAAKVNEGHIYKATVTTSSEQEATIKLTRL